MPDTWVFLDNQDQVVSASQSKAALESQKVIDSRPDSFPLLDQVLSHSPGQSLVIGRKLSMERDLYLSDHAIEGVPLFPGVMGLEAFSEAAGIFAPDLKVVAMENVQFRQALKVHKGKSIDMRICLQNISAPDEQKRIEAWVESDFIGPQEQKLGDTRIHFKAVLVMGKLQAMGYGPIHKQDSPDELIRENIYQILFHGPSFQVCNRIYRYTNNEVQASLHMNGNKLIKDMQPNWVIQPLLVELGLQAAGFYEYLQQEAPGATLPY